MLRSLSTVAIAGLVCFAGDANAAYSCSVSVTSISVAYTPTVPTENVTTGSYTVSCTRLVTDAATLTYNLRADNGLQPTGVLNRVQLGATTNRYSYELYRQAPYVNSNRWQAGTATQFLGTINFGAGLSGSAIGTFDLRLAGSQPVVLGGTYSDTVTVTLRQNLAGILSTTAFGVIVVTPNTCQINTAPGNISFMYTTFQASPATASTTFDTQCTTGLPYTLALDATSGTILGLNYTLSLSANNATGNGSNQTFSIDGSIANGQAGNCTIANCSGSQTRTLTISY